MLKDLTKFALDLGTSQAEALASSLSIKQLRKIAPTARTSNPVLLLPGYMSSDGDLQRMKAFLSGQGFQVDTWGLGRNTQLQHMSWRETLDMLETHLRQKVQAMSDRHSAPVSLIGHSIGGAYARDLGYRMESELDRVITLGSPIFHPYKVDPHNRLVNGLAQWLHPKHTSEMAEDRPLIHWEPDRPRVPFIAIHSPIDGITNEGACQIPDYIVTQCTTRSPRENLRLMASHMGMIASPLVFLALADRLNANRKAWKPFDPEIYFEGYLAPLARLCFPPGRELSPQFDADWYDRRKTAS